MSQYTDSLLEAMGIISDDAVGKSTNASTITGTIEEIVDAATGKYKVKHLSQIIDVTSGGNMKYAVGDKVYILVPDNDMSEEKFIIGAASSALNGVTNGLADDKRYKVSPNLIRPDMLNKEFSICSYENEVATISNGSWYDENLFQDYGGLGYTTFLITMKVKNELKGRRDGTYGIKDSYNVFDFNTAKMTGSIYDLPNWTTQNYYITLKESANTIFGDLLFYAEGYEAQSDKPKDIHIKDLGLYAIRVIKKEDLPGTHLELVPDRGSVLQDPGDFTNLDPLLYIDGEECSLQYSDFYWFKKNPSVDTMHPKYVPAGGYGWECLNEKDTEDNYIVDKNSLRVSTVDVFDKSIYKCVINFRAYQDVAAEVITSEPLMIRNVSSSRFSFKITAESDTLSYHPTEVVYLTAEVYTDPRNELKSGSSTFSWLRYDENGNIMDNRSYPFSIDPSVVRFEDNIIQERVFFPAVDINTKNTIVCGYYIDGSLVSIAEITITAKSESGYQLVITNGDIVYKYDVDGDSPYSSKANDLSKLQIRPLGFQIFKEDGTEFSEEEYAGCDVTWDAPDYRGEDSLIISSSWNPTGMTYTYTLAARYDKVKANNNVINLEVAIPYISEDLSHTIVTTLKASATIKCIKEGENGTNGTRYVAFPTFNSRAYNETVVEKGEPTPSRLTFLYEKSSTRPQVYYRTNDRADWNSFYQNYFGLGVRVYDVETGRYLIKEDEYKVSWKMVENKGVTYTSKGLPNPSPIKITPEGILSYDTSITELGPAIAQADVTILKNNKTVFDNTVIHCWYPFLLVKQEVPSVNHINEYFPTFNGAISSVMYESDGTEPAYATDGKEFNYDIELPYPLGLISDYFTITKDYSSSFMVQEEKLIPENKFLSACNAQYASIKLTNVNYWALTAAKTEIQNIYNTDASTQSYIDAAMNYLNQGVNYYNYGDWIATAKTNDTVSKKNIVNDILNIAGCIANAEGIRNAHMISVTDILQELSNICYYMDHTDMTRDEIIEYIYQVRNLLNRFYTVEINNNGFTSITFNRDIVRKYYFPNGSEDINEINKEYTDAMTAVNGLFAISDARTLEIMQSAIFYTNAYGFSELNGWDGTSASVDENTGLIVAPKVAAGYKESDNSLTGVVMGVKCTSEGREAGLFGYKKGSQSFKISAEDGSVELGTVSDGQILITPGTEGHWNATIATRGYVAGKYGSKIDLTTGHLDFGGGNLTWDNSQFKLGIGAIGDSNTVILSPTGISSSASIGGSGKSSKTWALTASNTFGVTKSGDVYASSITLNGTSGTNTIKITSNPYSSKINGYTVSKTVINASGTFGVDIDGTIYGSKLKLGSGTLGSDGSAYFSPQGYESGTVGDHTLASGQKWGLTLGSHFGVTLNGNLYADSLTLGAGGIGKDGSAYFDPSGLTGTLADTSRTDWGITLGDTFGVTTGGDLYAKNATIRGTIYIGDTNETLVSKVNSINTAFNDVWDEFNNKLPLKYDAIGAASSAYTDAKNYVDGTTYKEYIKGIADDQAAAYGSSHIGQLDGKVADYLLSPESQTVVGKQYIMSPYIGGGYLMISGDQYRVVIDPSNKINKSGTFFPFALYDLTKSQMVMGISNSGDAYFAGEIAANSGRIGSSEKGWTIMDAQIRSINTENGTVTGIQTNRATSNWVFFSGHPNIDPNGGLNYDGCEFRVSKTGQLWAKEAHFTGTDASVKVDITDGVYIDKGSYRTVIGTAYLNKSDPGPGIALVNSKKTVYIVNDNDDLTFCGPDGHGTDVYIKGNLYVTGDIGLGASAVETIKEIIDDWVKEHS